MYKTLALTENDFITTDKDHFIIVDTSESCENIFDTTVINNIEELSFELKMLNINKCKAASVMMICILIKIKQIIKQKFNLKK